MVDHYFSRQPEIASDPIYWDATLRNHLFHFKTDQGVFSKNEVDFGSRFLIESFQMPEREGLLLDIGCGYGPIGLALAKEFPDRQVHMVDINQRAIKLAEENARLNHIQNIDIYESDGLQKVKEMNFAAIVTNPPIRAGKQLVHQMFEQSYQHLITDGELWVVIQKKQGAPSAKKKLEDLYRQVETWEKRKGYYILKAIK
ncbi:class I SAM-dependent methyltransferase [Lederbergia sp. NSJ-179]|uniref:class I SAM-dependent methyltransferase n=1 Tax=Lederbergia sp. NSJ-179 TaxID=2931402 RepID=UPI001FD04FF9|nr:class I SAM-dependent methyltransferase [Lederbergia sp. NSJ-179]MCJ7843042.1 class I SAM-dependent methyltransferase [Lederbergia sp. NSJ-179]